MVINVCGSDSTKNVEEYEEFMQMLKICDSGWRKEGGSKTVHRGCGFFKVPLKLCGPQCWCGVAAAPGGLNKVMWLDS